MAEITLQGFEWKQIENIAGKAISLREITIPNSDFTQFSIEYEIINQNNLNVSSKLFPCDPGLYEWSGPSGILHIPGIEVPDTCNFFIRMISAANPNFNGTATIVYELITVPSGHRPPR